VATLTLFSLLGLGLVPGLLASPAAAQEEIAPTFVGRVDGTDAYIGLVTNGDDLFVYICDGTALTLHDEFHGAAHDAENGVIAMQSQNGHILGIRVDAGSLSEIMATGSAITGNLISAEGGGYSVRLGRAVAPGGLWVQEEVLSDGTVIEGGWVVLNDGSIRGFVNPGNCPNGACGGLPPGGSGMNAQAGGQNATGAWGGPALDADAADSGFEYGDLTNYQPPQVAQQYNFARPTQQQVQHTVTTPAGPVVHTPRRAQP
jgi:hypothetical protein